MRVGIIIEKWTQSRSRVGVGSGKEVLLGLEGWKLYFISPASMSYSLKLLFPDNTLSRHANKYVRVVQNMVNLLIYFKLGWFSKCSCFHLSMSYHRSQKTWSPYCPLTFTQLATSRPSSSVGGRRKDGDAINTVYGAKKGHSVTWLAGYFHPAT